MHWPLLLPIALVLVIVLAVVYGAAQTAKRTRDVIARGADMGFAPVADVGWASVYSMPHGLFKRGRDRSAYNVIEGAAGGLRARLFDYSYRTGSGRSEATYVQTVAAFQLPGTLPAFEMYPEHWYHHIAEFLGFSRIVFEGFDAFSDNYRLLGTDEPAIRSLFKPAAVSALGQRPGWTVEGAGQTLLVYRPTEIVAPDRLPEFLARALEVAGAFELR